MSQRRGSFSNWQRSNRQRREVISRIPPPSRGRYSPSPIVPVPVITPVPIYRPHWWGYGRPIERNVIIINGQEVTESVYETGAQRYGVYWKCPLVSESATQSMKSFGWVLMSLFLLMFIIYPLWSWFYYGMVYPEDIYIMLGISIFIVPVSVILLAVSYNRQKNCYQSYTK